MKTIREVPRGGAVLRLVEQGRRYIGVVITKNTIGWQIEGDEPEEVWSRLESEAAKASPAYFGFAGARARFLRIFPGGFTDPAADRERGYKLKAKAKLDKAVPLETALAGTGYGQAIRAVFSATNLLAPIESARIGEVLRSPSSDDFVRGAAALATGDVERGLSEIERALKPFGVATWPAATYLSFLWSPNTEMFLKPEVTKDFAERVGHPFAYESGLAPAVYRSLLALAETTAREIADLGAQDMIDVQSFIWVVGKYTEADVIQVHREAAMIGQGASQGDTP